MNTILNQHKASKQKRQVRSIDKCDIPFSGESVGKTENFDFAKIR